MSAGGGSGVGSGGTGPNGGIDTGGTGSGAAGRGGSNPGVAGSSIDAGAAGVAEGGGGASGSSGGHAGGGSAGSGMGGSGINGGSAGSSALGGSGGASTIDMIDDFEADDAAKQVILNNGRNGFWYAFHDLPATNAQPFAIVSDTTRSGSAFTLHMSGMGFTGYGAGFGADFVNVSMVKAAYDVSAYKGIRFYAKIATGTQPNLKVLIPTTYSDPMGGKCTSSAANCNDHLFCPVNGVTTAWALYECDFSNLRQVGFGLPQNALDPKSVYSVQFSLLTTTLAANIWVDDVAFVLK